MERKKLEEVIKRLNITNSYAADYIRKNTANVNFSLVDEEKFDEWFDPLADSNYFQKKNFPAAAFVNVLKIEIQKGTFKVIDCHESKEVIKPGTLEPIDSFEAKVDEWIELIYETTGQYPDSEARAFDKNGNLRGYYDGKGGFFYTDGTVSSKWPCGLPPVKKDPSSHNKEIEQKILEGLT